MAIRATLSGLQIVNITGFTGQRARVIDAAWEMQRELAERFEGSRTGAGALLPNSREYNVRKVMDGFDPRRGHRTGAIQEALYTVPCFTVRGSKRDGKWLVRFSDAPLISAVDHAEYYAEQKARGGVLVALNKTIVNAGVAVLRGAEPTAQQEPLLPVDDALLRVARGVASTTRVRDGVSQVGVRVA
jgi:hypothetical protein